MEIIDYLRARRDRVRLVLLVPLGAVVLSLLATTALPDRYRAELTVAVPAPTADHRAARVQAAEDLTALLDDPEVRASVPGASDAHIDVTQDGASVRIVLSTTEPGRNAAGTLVALTEAGLEDLFAQPIAEVASARDAALQRSREAQTALRAFEEQRAAPSASTRYQAVLEELAQLRRDREVAVAADDDELASGLQRLIEERRAEKVALEAVLPDYRVVEREAAAAATQAETARGAVDGATARLDGTVDRLDALVDGPLVVGAGTEMLRRALAAGAIGLLLAAGALGLGEVLRPAVPVIAQRRGDEESVRSDDDLDDAVVAAPPARADLRHLMEPHPVP